MIKRYDKFKVLSHIFMNKTENGTKNIGKDIDFSLQEISKAITKTGGIPPSSCSNFVLDLTRRDKGISKRLPESVLSFGYDLRKKTGPIPNNPNESYCGTFVYCGLDENNKPIPLKDWFKEWDNINRCIKVKNRVPEIVQKFISNDEASLFSVIDYCNILTIVLGTKVYKVQSPMKQHPNEIDGFYVAEDKGNIYAYPVEAKAISTNDDINLVQLFGQYNMFVEKYKGSDLCLIIRPIAIRMKNNGLLLAILEINPLFDPTYNSKAQIFNVKEVVKVEFDFPLKNWTKKKKSR